jgi:hypothetical protein
MHRVLPFVQTVALSLITIACCTVQAASAQSKFDTMHIGAFDPDAWNGIVFDGTAYQERLTFAIRVGSKGREFLDGERIFTAVDAVGPHAPDGSYASISWRHAPQTAPITLEWARVDDNVVVGRLTAPPGVRLVIEAYSPFETSSTALFHTVAGDNEITGVHYIDGHIGTAARFLIRTDHPLLGAATFTDVSQLRALMDAGELPNASGKDPAASRSDTSRIGDVSLNGAAGIEFQGEEGAPVHFVAVEGWDSDTLSGKANEWLTPNRIDEVLTQNAKRYEETRPHVDGLFNGATYPIGNTMFWNTLYVPSVGLEFPSISRRWAKLFGGWVVGEWDCFFGSLLTNVEDTDQTSAAVRAILLAQSPDGVVPNVTSGDGGNPDRAQPPVGSYTVWKNYERNQDVDLLRWAYPHLKLWHEWWFKNRGDGQPERDGNRDGLLEWGSDRGSLPSVGGRGNLLTAKYESGMDDSPMYDDVRFDAVSDTMNLDDVGLNSLYALDSESMEKIAGILGMQDDERVFAADYARMKAAMQKLWNDDDGIFENRYWDGSFSKRLSPTNFYPLIAGVATPQQAERMIKNHLLNPNEFWGQYVIPTISRNDAAFKEQYYWRGDIWGPTNYLVYEGLNRYGKDETALEFAEKSYGLFKSDWERNQHSDENYSPWGGTAGGDPHYTWGTLLCLIPLEQFMDETPWDGLRFGALNPSSESVLSNYAWAGHRYRVTIGPNRTAVERDGKLQIEADAGVVFRNFKSETGSLSFTIDTVRPASVTIREFSSAPVSASIDNVAAKPSSIKSGATVVTIPAGKHSFSGVWTQPAGSGVSK